MALRLDDLAQLGDRWQWRYRKQITWLAECNAIPYFIRHENGDFSTFDEDWNSLWKWWRSDGRSALRVMPCSASPAETPSKKTA